MGFKHTITARAIAHGEGTSLGAIYIITFLVLVWQAVLYAIDRPRRTAARHAVDMLRTVVAVPCYDEDPAILRRSLLSMLAQTRLPDHVFVVDDGSNKADYSEVRREFQVRAADVRVKVTWVRTKNGGKQNAHAVAVRGTPEADIYITIDSDGILYPHAIEELLIPFADRTVQSVAGIVSAANSGTPAASAGSAAGTPVSAETCQPASRHAAPLMPWQASTTTLPRTTAATFAASMAANSGQAVTTTMTSAPAAAARAVSA